MSDFFNIYFDWFLGYLFLVLPGIVVFTLMIVKLFKIVTKRNRWITFFALALLIHTIFFVYYDHQLSRMGEVTRIISADDVLMVEGVLTNTGYRSSRGSASGFREDPATTTQAQKIFVFDKKSGNILQRIEDYQVAHYAERRAFLVPTIATKSYAIFDTRVSRFDRFFISSDLRSDMPELANRIDKITYDRSWMLKPDMSGSGWDEAVPYFELTLSDGSGLYYDVLTGETHPRDKKQTTWTDEKRPALFTEYADFTIDSSSTGVVRALKKRASENGFVLFAVRADGQKKWTVTAEQIHPEIKDDRFFFSENPGSYLVEDGKLYFFTYRFAVALDTENGNILWQQSI